MMRVEPKHNTEQSSATCSSVKNSKYLFCSCFTVAGYFLISFSFMVRSYTCLFSFSNKLPFESKSLYMQVLIQFLSSLSHYHHIIYSVRIHRHARFVGVGLFSGVTFTASQSCSCLHAYMVDLGRDRDLRRPKERSR